MEIENIVVFLRGIEKRLSKITKKIAKQLNSNKISYLVRSKFLI